MPLRLLAVVIEGNAEISGDYSTSLRRAGYYVVEAATLGAAQTAVRAVYPDLVVLGGALPDGDALMMLETWRRSRTAMKNVPVVVLMVDGRRKEIDAVVRECLEATLLVASETMTASAT